MRRRNHTIPTLPTSKVLNKFLKRNFLLEIVHWLCTTVVRLVPVDGGVDGKDEKVEAYLEDQFENAIKSLFTKINFAIHILANK